MKKVILAIIGIGSLAFASICAAAPSQSNAVVAAFMDGAYQYMGDSRASYSQGFYSGIVLARAYESQACVTGRSNKEILVAVGSVLLRSTDMDKIGNVNAIADAAISSAFPCK